jgi:hypothetical protein
MRTAMASTTTAQAMEPVHRMAQVGNAALEEAAEMVTVPARTSLTKMATVSTTIARTRVFVHRTEPVSGKEQSAELAVAVAAEWESKADAVAEARTEVRD